MGYSLYIQAQRSSYADLSHPWTPILLAFSFFTFDLVTGRKNLSKSGNESRWITLTHFTILSVYYSFSPRYMCTSLLLGMLRGVENVDAIETVLSIDDDRRRGYSSRDILFPRVDFEFSLWFINGELRKLFWDDMNQYCKHLRKMYWRDFAPSVSSTRDARKFHYMSHYRRKEGRKILRLEYTIHQN